MAAACELTACTVTPSEASCDHRSTPQRCDRSTMSTVVVLNGAMSGYLAARCGRAFRLERAHNEPAVPVRQLRNGATRTLTVLKFSPLQFSAIQAKGQAFDSHKDVIAQAVGRITSRIAAPHARYPAITVRVIARACVGVAGVCWRWCRRFFPTPPRDTASSTLGKLPYSEDRAGTCRRVKGFFPNRNNKRDCSPCPLFFG